MYKNKQALVHNDGSEPEQRSFGAGVELRSRGCQRKPELCGLFFSHYQLMCLLCNSSIHPFLLALLAAPRPKLLTEPPTKPAMPNFSVRCQTPCPSLALLLMMSECIRQSTQVPATVPLRIVVQPPAAARRRNALKPPPSTNTSQSTTASAPHHPTNLASHSLTP